MSTMTDEMTTIIVSEWDAENMQWGYTRDIEVTNVWEWASDRFLASHSALTIDIPNGTYNDGNAMHRRWVLEAAMPWVGLGLHHKVYVGFAWVDKTIGDPHPDDFDGYRKQRWAVL